MNMVEKNTLNEYKIEDQQLSDSILKFNYYTYWTKGDGTIELFVTLDNGGTKIFKEFCGIQNLIYPESLSDPQIILSNIKKFLTWYNSNKFQCDISLFGDGWVDTPLFESVMSALYVSFKGSLFVPKQIFIPIPVQSFQSADCIEYLTHTYQVFKEELNIDIIYQIYAIGGAVDGVSEDTYRSMFCFTVDVASSKIVSTIYQQDMASWETNALWWTTVPLAIFDKVQFKVETSNKWEDEDLNRFQRVLKILSDNLIKSLSAENDSNVDFKKLFIGSHLNQDTSITQFEFNNFTKGTDFLGYGIHNSLCIRCGDLAVPISKGLCYDYLLIGKFNTDEDSITEFKSIQAERFIPKIYTKISCLPHCEACPFVGICSGFDPAVAFQIYLDPFIAVRKHCNLQKIRLGFLIDVLDTNKMFDDLSSLGLSASEKIYFEDLLKCVRETNNK